ncbi:hypothetical protein [Shimia sp.]|uniref:hypothetical protein n=1 Tax=Shimia sp. TaxID=1954381 RepID=UPI003B8D45D0
MTYLLCAPCTTRGAGALSHLMDMIGQDYGEDDIDEAISQITAKDMTTVLALLPKIEAQSLSFATALRTALRKAPSDVPKEALNRAPSTPDLFA